jgi:hypothetical protein
MFLDYVVQMKYQQMQHATRYNLCKVKHFWYLTIVVNYKGKKRKVVPVLNELSTTPWRRMGE